MDLYLATAFALWGLGGILTAVREHGRWCDANDIYDCGMSRIFATAVLWPVVLAWKLILKGIGK